MSGYGIDVGSRVDQESRNRDRILLSGKGRA